MVDVLSQNEIDALLSALSTGEMDAEELKKEESEKKVKVYDFKRALRFSKEQIRSLTRLHENFARLLTTYFSAQLRTYVQIGVASVDQLPYEEFIRSVPKMTLLNVFEAHPFEGRILMEVNPNIAYAMLDRVMGGSGAGMNKIENLTEIETRIMNQLFENTLDSFKEAWTSVIELEPFMLDLEVNPQFLQMVSPNETVVVISLNTTIGETSGMINICLPHVVIEPIIPKLSVHHWMQNKKKTPIPGETEFIEQKIKNAFLPFKVELGSSDMSIEEFLNLSIGDCIELDQRINQPLVIKVENNPKFYGQPGKVKKKLAVQIIETIKEDEDQW
ncbi:flagellar motor switch protein FliM [Fictibacillus nanhaiensis]|uniref:Flagellar motor switch protein FliM n=2 Tax=Fictibacillus TaxID=1329200 RepID=A0A160IMG2_9BACL|nr:flagellar motor switch protein FliM [Fictibacillus phosphorivorans]ANC76870.1 flagellar motor switch protein FliM [Fictibacillus phosphorivorans]MBN3555230.1 flagellar motor switch protein FliM [Fictibacillus nanhaiensis]MQR96514.1 flagellar motor switch protein FliM [Fictibacillus phosphorivorans]